ncbi:MAG TPA: hypothetical protein VKT28_01860 [Puia sp.]|nr:hypothetical protein [Puia sp.]
MKTKKYFSPILWVALIFFTGNLSVYGQQTDSIKRSKKIIDSVLSSENLIPLNGNPNTFYSSGFDMRAKTVQKLINGCAEFYENIFPKETFLVHLYLLNKADWEKSHFEQPYGMPFYNPDYDILVIASEKNALAKLTGLKDLSNSSDSVLTGLDYQPLHELGHYFFFTLNNINKEKWFNEFLATYFLICYLKAENLEPNLDKELKADYPVAHKTLEDFQKFYGGVGPANYHWYQSKFAELGFKLYPQLKTNLIKAVLDNYKSGGKQIDGISLLKHLAPDITKEWLKEMQ